RNTLFARWCQAKLAARFGARSVQRIPRVVERPRVIVRGYRKRLADRDGRGGGQDDELEPHHSLLLRMNPPDAMSEDPIRPLELATNRVRAATWAFGCLGHTPRRRREGMIDDPVLVSDWHPVATTDQLDAC